MSVCMALYKINPNVVYNGYYFDFMKNKDFIPDENGNIPINKIEKELGIPENPYDLWDWTEKQETEAWSDKVKHTFFELNYYKSMFEKKRSWKRTRNRLSKYDFKIFDNGMEKKKYLALDTVEYAQGWFFKKKFFNKEVTTVFCTTKKELQNFITQYVQCKNNEEREIINRFLNSWEDGMLFECSW